MTAPRFLVATAVVAGETRSLDRDTVRHIRALRLRPGDPLVLTDGNGRQASVVLATLSPAEATVEPRPEVPEDNESALDLTLYVALLKRDKLEWVVEKGTEIGVSRFVLVDSERSLRAARATRLDRLDRVARAAVEQCQRRIAPIIEGPLAIETALEAESGSDLRLFFWEEASATRASVTGANQSATSVAAMVGPEGGFARHEAERAATLGWQLLRLGPRVLRAETAAISAAVFAQTLWGDFDACR